MIAFLFFGSVDALGGFSPIAGSTSYTPGVHRRHRATTGSASTTSRSIVAVFVYVLIRYLVRTPFGISLQGVRDEPVRMASLGYNVALHRTLAFGFGGVRRGARRRALRLVERPVSPDDDRARRDDPPAHDRASSAASRRIEGAWLGAVRVPRDQQRGHEPRSRRTGCPVVGGTFNTVIGVIFLAIVLVSPDGLMGIWDRIWERRGRPRAAPHAGSKAGRSGRRRRASSS